MKLKFLFLFCLCCLALNSSAQFSMPWDNLFSYKAGDPRVQAVPYMADMSEKIAEEYELWRENPAALLAVLGEDLDWLEDVKKAKASGGYVVEAEIKPGEPAELCMMPSDAEKVTHLKLTGRAVKWGIYGPDNMQLGRFLKSLKNLKVLNLRDLDAEMFWFISLNRVEKIVFPANCAYTMITDVPRLKEIKFGPRLKAFGTPKFSENHKTYRIEGIKGGFAVGQIQELEIPEGVEFIGVLIPGLKTRKITLPSTLKAMASFGDNVLPPYLQHIENLKEVHLKCAIPPVMEDFLLKYENLKHVTLYVPKGAKTAYARDLNWRNFGAIIEEDVVIKAISIDEQPSIKGDASEVDLEEEKPIEELISGKWKLVKGDLHDPLGLLKGQKLFQTNWICIENGEWAECVMKDGKEVITKLKYEINGRELYLIQPNLKSKLIVENVRENELELSMSAADPKLDIKLTFHYVKME